MPNQFLSPEGDLENYFVTESWLIDQYVGDTLLTWGAGDFVALGVNDTTIRLTPVTTLAGGANWKQVSCGNYNGAAIKTDGTLWVWGANFSGQLGVNSSNIHRSTPVTTFAGGTNWKQVSSSSQTFMAAIKTDGTLWTWGDNSYGQLGINNTTSPICTPVTTFAGGTNWKQVCGGYRHAAAIKTDGTLWTWGSNSGGALGVNSASPFASVVNDKLTPVTTFAGGTNWKQVGFAGHTNNETFTAAIKTDGTLWTWGNNGFGQLGINAAPPYMMCTPVTTFAGGTNWKQVTGGTLSLGAIKTDGTLWTWGRNDAGILGNNTLGNINIFTPVTTFAGGTNWKQISMGSAHTAAIKTDGTLWIWGGNVRGQLGVNSQSTYPTYTNNNKITPVTTLAGGTNWKQVACGSLHTAAITSGTDPTYFIS